MSNTYIDTNDFEALQGINVSEELRVLTDEEFSYWLAHGTLDRDVELN